MTKERLFIKFDETPSSEEFQPNDLDLSEGKSLSFLPTGVLPPPGDEFGGLPPLNGSQANADGTPAEAAPPPPAPPQGPDPA
jgi:hypothetical protein